VPKARNVSSMAWRPGARSSSERSVSWARTSAASSAGRSQTAAAASTSNGPANADRSLNDYGFFRLRPDVMAWADAVAAADPADESPCAPTVWVVSAYGAWMAGDLAGHDARAVRAVRAAGGSDAGLPPGTHPEVAVVRGNVDLFAGRLREAVRWYRRALEAAGDDAVRRVFSQATELLALGYSDDPSAATVADALLAEVGDDVTPLAAYAWYCAGEAVASRDVVRARHRHARALDLAAATGTSAITGLAGASMASIDARHGDADVAAEAYRDLIAHWRRAGMWPTQWTMLRSIADLLARRGRHREAAALEGAVRATRAGHEIFGADEVALAALGSRLRGHLGDETYDQARAEGAELDGDAAAELALAALGPTSGAAPPGSRGSPSRPARA
jgi:tetratricopeptide (TPR) repeat protein